MENQPVPHNPYALPPQSIPHYMMPQAHPLLLINLNEAIRDYLRFKQAKRRDSKTISDISQSLHTLHFVRPDITHVHQITKSVILDFETLLADIPANYRKTAKLRDKSYDELRIVGRDLPKLAPASIDKYTITLRAFVNWCQDTDRMAAWKLPRFEGLDKRSSKDKRHPFTREEVEKLLTSPQYAGHAEDLPIQLQRHVPGGMVIRDCYYWVPLMALYTGMRRREILQLFITDVREEAGVPYFDINADGEGKSLKNSASKRKVPVHPELVKLGLLQHIERQRRASHKRIFHDVPVTEAGDICDIFSRRFARYLIATGIKHRKLSFHSLRHTFIDQAARQARLPDNIIKALVGHADHTITFGTYGGRLTLEELAEAINKIDYGTAALTYSPPAGEPSLPLPEASDLSRDLSQDYDPYQ